MKYCSRCAKSFKDESQFCNVCGSALVSAEFCPSCGAILGEGSAFCNKCGHKLGASGDAPSAQAENNVFSGFTPQGFEPQENVDYISDVYGKPVSSWSSRLFARIVHKVKIDAQVFSSVGQVSKHYDFYEVGEETAAQLGAGESSTNPCALITNKGNLYVSTTGVKGKVTKVPENNFVGVADNHNDISRFKLAIALSLITTVIVAFFLGVEIINALSNYGYNPLIPILCPLFVMEVALVILAFRSIYTNRVRLLIVLQLIETVGVLGLLVYMTFSVLSDDSLGLLIGPAVIVLYTLSKIKFFNRISEGYVFFPRTIICTSNGTFVLDNYLYTSSAITGFMAYAANIGKYRKRSPVPAIGSRIHTNVSFSVTSRDRMTFADTPSASSAFLDAPIAESGSSVFASSDQSRVELESKQHSESSGPSMFASSAQSESQSSDSGPTFRMKVGTVVKIAEFIGNPKTKWAVVAVIFVCAILVGTFICANSIKNRPYFCKVSGCEEELENGVKEGYCSRHEYLEDYESALAPFKN